MRKFVCKVICFVLIISVITVALNQIYKKMDISDNDSTRKFHSIPDSIDICNFGSSHGLFGYCYDNHESEYTCFNFGLVSQTLSYDYRLLYNYQNHIDEGSIVFITVSYFSFLGKGELIEEGFESKNKRYYKVLPRNLIKSYDFVTDLYTNILPAIDQYDNIAAVMLQWLHRKDEIDIQTAWDRTADPIEVKEDAESAVIRHTVTNKREEDGTIVINQEEIDALYDMITLCQELGATPILITTPYLSEYTDEIMKISPDVCDEFYGIINDVIKDKGVEYYDYSNDKRFSSEYSLFMNSDHLNHLGAIKFVDILFDEVVYKYNYR